MIMDDFIKRSISYFRGQPDIVFAYLFGSQVRSQAASHSDIDVAIYLNNSEPANNRESRLDDIYHQMVLLSPPASLDLIDLALAPAHLSYEVLQHGKLLFCVDEKKRISFIARVLRDFFDLSYYRELHFKKMEQRIKEGNFGHL